MSYPGGESGEKESNESAAVSSRARELAEKIAAYNVSRGASGAIEPAGREIKVICPAHEDHKPSLSITEKEGRLLYRCLSGCEGKAVTAALVAAGIRPAAKVLDLDKPKLTHYRYTDANGVLLFEVERRDPGKKFKQRRPDGAGGWIYNIEGVDRVLYNLPAVTAAARSAGTVYFVEGEKDADNLKAQGLTATSISGGANGPWFRNYVTALEGAGEVVIIPDNDDPGRKHAERVRQHLSDAGIRCIVAELPGLEKKQDVSDYLQNHSIDALMRVIEQCRTRSGRVAYEDSDLGTADWFLAYCGGTVRYCYELGAWFVYNGRYWEKSEAAIERKAKAFIEAMKEYAKELQPKPAEELLDRARELSNRYKFRAMIDTARAHCEVKICDFDADPWLLNTATGTIDLRDSTIRGHLASDMLTRCAPVRYDPTAACPVFEKFLLEIFQGNQELIRYVQKAVGYSLTGCSDERAAFFLWGAQGANGKSTLLEALRAVLGDEYYKVCPAETILEKPTGDGISNDVARLRGARVAAISEAEEGRRLAESKLKNLTGNETITARFLHQEFFDYKPQFKLWFLVNHKPVIRGTDAAIWNRIKLIPFLRSFAPEEQDRTLPDKLRAEAPGIFNWALEGARLWVREGLKDIPDVTNAVSEYRSEMDNLADFIADNCELGAAYTTRHSTIYASYKSWAERNGYKPISSKRFSLKLSEFGYKKDRNSGNAAAWQGIRLVAESINEESPF